MAIAEKFAQRWDFPRCIGALDGKHVVLRAPVKSGSFFYNYKGIHSIVLLALVDADYKFIMVDVGCNGRISDGGVLRNSNFGRALLQGAFTLPGPAPLPNRSLPIPPVIVADDAFPLTDNIMKPFGNRQLTQPHRIFNYRLSRARRIVENAFGILANRFRVFSPITIDPDKAEHLVLAACSLHNYLRIQGDPFGSEKIDREDDTTHEFVERRWRSEPMGGISNLPRDKANMSSRSAREIRDELSNYFSSPAGAVPWQHRMI
jgi:hypothetical protein